MGIREHQWILQYSWITRMVDTRANAGWHGYQIYPMGWDIYHTICTYEYTL